MKRFSRYFIFGMSTLSLDVGILFVLKQYAGWNYLLAATTSFIIAASLSYHLNRTFVFTGTKRHVVSGYLIFMCILGMGLAMVLVGMIIFVEVFHMNYIVARLAIAAIVGLWNYFMNLHVNFKITEN